MFVARGKNDVADDIKTAPLHWQAISSQCQIQKWEQKYWKSDWYTCDSFKYENGKKTNVLIFILQRLWELQPTRLRWHLADKRLNWIDLYIGKEREDENEMKSNQRSTWHNERSCFSVFIWNWITFCVVRW